MKAKLLQSTLLALLALCSNTPHVWADPPTGYLQLAQGIDKSRAAEIAKQRYGGKVLKVDVSSKNGQSIYKVRLLLEGGRIKTVKIDGAKGRVL